MRLWLWLRVSLVLTVVEARVVPGPVVCHLDVFECLVRRGHWNVIEWLVEWSHCRGESKAGIDCLVVVYSKADGAEANVRTRQA